jgi:amino acid transporter
LIFVLLLFTGGFTTFMKGRWSTETFISSYINLPLFALVYAGYKLFMKTKILPLEDIPIRPFIESARNSPEPPVKRKRGLARLNILWS